MSDEDLESMEEENDEEEIDSEDIPKRKKKRRQRLIVDEDPRKTKAQIIIYSLLIFVSLIIPIVITIPLVFLDIDPIISFVVAIVTMVVGITIAGIIINNKILFEPKSKK